MKRMLAAPSKWIGSKFSGVVQRFNVSPALAEWRQIEGDRHHRVEYPLDQDSIVIDVGGYRGDWASDIYSRYRCTVHIVEPVPQFAEQLRSRFAQNPDVEVHQVALGRAAGTQTMTLDADASRVSATGGIQVSAIGVGDFLEELDAAWVDLMKINIEGAEYDLIEDLAITRWITRIRDIQVQFHDFVPDAEAKLERATELLSRTHTPTYSYRFVWDNWRLRSSA